MTKASPRLVGAFVVGGIALLIGGIFAFGSMQLFKDHIPVVMRFDEDLTGLDPGAPVTFRGVQIGTVTDIALLFNADTRTFQSPVRVQIEPDRFQIAGSPPRLGQNLAYFIDQGLRGRLASQSVLTGKRLIEVGFYPDTPVHLSEKKSDIPEIPTIPSQLEQLQAGLGGLFRKLEQTALPELVNDLRTTVQTLGVVLSELDASRLGTVADDASATLRSGRAVFDNLNQRIDVIAPMGASAVQNADQLIQELQKAAVRIGPAVAGLQRAAERADRLLADANVVIEPGSQTHRELVAVLRDVSAAARSMRTLTDDLDRNPNSLLFGKTSARGAR
jgi:paraquat-inducible protein B